MEIAIAHQWDGDDIDHASVKMWLKEGEDGMKIEIKAPYFHDPKPTGESGQSMWQLWDYEVVEAFFLNSDSGEYLELEFGPHGQYLALLFKGCRNLWKKDLSLKYSAKIHGNEWQGNAVIPWDYFPENLNKFNMYAIHGTDPNRAYESLQPAPKDKYTTPDFHRLEYFRDIKPEDVFPNGNWKKCVSSIWNQE
ncbi:UPF0462 protein C4orf33 homolog [Clavelina lepadiformis]|uniref:UPF0462 protein C4orf33 homolog n=1 Tax=Clavelina lepadiformis TaxID=159417 RepID=UPI00404280E2